MFNKDPDGLLISYYGPFSMKILSDIVKYLIDNKNGPLTIRMKLYRVCIEIADNVNRYSAKREQLADESTVGMGKIIIQDNDDYYTCRTINEILPEHENKLMNNCNEINETSGEKLKLRRIALRKESLFNEASAHIGLISIRMHSDNPLGFEIIKDNEEKKMYFSITAKINKT